MNKLWEQFVYVSLRKNLPKFHISAQSSKYFWQHEIGYCNSIRPDIVLRMGDLTIVLDTKWKNMNGNNPSTEDLRQMFVYHKYFKAQKTALIYPGEESIMKGTYFDFDSNLNVEMQCSIIKIEVETSNVNKWQKQISEKINGWINE